MLEAVASIAGTSVSDDGKHARESVPAGAEPGGDEGAAGPDPLIGQVLGGRYRVVERLAEGGMGTVYRGEHIALHKEVAIKLVLDAANSDHATRFLREAMLTSRIDHPNVVSTIDYGSLDDGSAYLVMNLVEGPTLAHAMWSERPMWWVRAAEIAAQIVDAVAAAQAQGIVHRDLKPENVVLQPMPDGTFVVKVLDFGVAKYARDSLAPPPVRGAQHVTRLGVVIGTPGYMAPEQAVGMRADHRADLYAVGVMLWECIAGHRLWDCDDVQRLLTIQLGTRPQLLREETGDPTLPEELETLVAELLATRPERRPQSAVEVRDRLRALVEMGRRESQLSIEPATAAIAQPRTVSIPQPPPTSTVFIADALARWRAAAGQPEPQPTTRIGFRGAGPIARDGAPSNPAVHSLPLERAADEQAGEPALPPGEPQAQSVAALPRVSARLYAAVPLAIAVLAGVLWAMPEPDSPSPPVSARAPAAAPAPAEPSAAKAQTAEAPASESASAAAAEAPESARIPAPAASTPAPAARVQRSKMRTASQAAPARTLSARERAAALRAQARAHWRRSEFADAAQAYRRAIKADPGHAGAYAGLGACQLALGDARGAIDSYNQAIRRSPKASGFHAALGRAYLTAGDRPRALAAYRKAAALDPDNYAAATALAQLDP